MGRKVILVGCGNMGHAMLKGWLDGALAPADVAVVEPTEALRTRAAGLGVTAVASADALPAGGDVVVFAVKPQAIGEVAPAYRAHVAAGATVVSVAAGIGVATFEELLGRQAPVIRCMPNTPAAIGKGMMVLFANRHVDGDTFGFVEALMARSGAVATIDNEALMDAVTAVSGSGPAYVFHFIECLTEAGTQAGLPRETAAQLAMQTVYGAACLARESGEAPGRLREQVTSPNGTTAAALAVLMGENRLLELVDEAVAAAKKRSVELGKS
ncbi:pyrroline-5-carboxylate reductase [Aquibium sp. A9E412]|uniref:pyrroline-5-carboxylate reductase n=1 Tax=Aquibium sp. A9E412 TaxID=2976767 RepID=UPI0025B07555|nr:pyrroline-5-carboxylate reductase [Aquibium sp. A9E412]MDN2565840.1 pyrroline-5-carboxylate reductase [Aquibium sp. A9E412]